MEYEIVYNLCKLCSNRKILEALMEDPKKDDFIKNEIYKNNMVYCLNCKLK